MERPAKRQRLFTPIERDFVQGFDGQHEFYDSQGEELEEDEEQGYDPDQDLQQKRARLDYKLKSTFEAIFEKYEQDFDGIGDEIDLETGEILVNNGHLLAMQDERDAGTSGRRRSILQSATPETEEVTNSSQEEDDMNEMDDDEDDEEEFSDEEMIEDDMILRGFAQASQFIQRQLSPEQTSLTNDFMETLEPPRRPAVARPSMRASVLPSRSEIMSQFGPQLGPEIAKFVKQKGGLDDTSIEPAWRAPPIAPAIQKKRPKVKPVKFLPEIERSPSPENSKSVWATAQQKRTRFTEEEDELLLDFVAKARRRGHDLSSHLTWKQLEAMHPRHGWNSWKTHYRNKFTYLSSGNVEDSELSTSEVSLGFREPVKQKHKNELRGNRADVPSHAPTTGVQRSTRVRKPAQKDPNILSWSQAVPILESGDPFQHAELLEDARRTNAGASFRFNHPTPASTNVPESHKSQKESMSNHRSNQYPDISNPLRKSTNRLDRFASGTEDELAQHGPAPVSISPERASCPHVGCRNYGSTKYRLKRYYDEELSPMNSHLLHVHHTTPFPCGEMNCDRKGDHGFFMQTDLIMHVRESHPYPTALHRLRGRVDSELLEQKIDSRRPIPSTELPRPFTPQGQPRDSDFLSPQRKGLSSSSQQLSLISPGYNKTLTPNGVKATAERNGADPSSLRVNPSSATARDAHFEGPFEEPEYDSDVQILDTNPFLNRETPTKQGKAYSCPLKDSFGCEKKFTTASSAVSHAKVHTSEKAQCSHPGCLRMISTAQPNSMTNHLKWHERQDSISIPALNGPASEPKLPIPSSIPNSQSSSIDFPSIVPAVVPQSPQIIKKKQVNQPIPRNTVDPSYEFSDEEKVPPAATKQLTGVAKGIPSKNAKPIQTAPIPAKLSNKAPQPTHESAASASYTPQPVQTKPVPAKASNKALQPNQEFAPSMSEVVASVENPQLVTPAMKQNPRRSVVRGVLEAEDLDELSLGPDDFLLISSRPRLNPVPLTGSHVRVKREETAGPSSVLSIRKRRFSDLASDEPDELGADGPSNGRMLGLQTHIKKESDNPIEQRRPIPNPTKPRRKRTSGGVQGSSSQPNSQSHPQPKPALSKPQKKADKISTPLMDLVADEEQRHTIGTGQSRSTPSTSDIGSSPTAQRGIPRTEGSPILGMVTPIRQKHWSAKVKQEEEDGIVKTPGGTLRRCGEEGFTCCRAFCFKCSSVS